MHDPPSVEVSPIFKQDRQKLSNNWEHQAVTSPHSAFAIIPPMRRLARHVFTILSAAIPRRGKEAIG
jgi:hypothetical protein